MRRRVSCAAIGLLVLSAVAVRAQSVDEIVAKNIQAKGGAEKWKSVSSVKMTGTITMQGTDMPLIVYAKRPNLTRQEITLPADRRLVQAFDGTTGWMINPMMGGDTPQELPPAISEMMRNTSDFDGPLVNYKDKGNTIEIVGTEKLGEKDVHHLKITMKGGTVQHYYLDAATGIELKKAEEVDMGTGQKQTLETEMADYQQVEGVMMPKTVRQLMNGKPVVEMSIDKVEFNTAVDDKLFRMPGK
jgi:outer membrane lipoprotein-sorting protein